MVKCAVCNRPAAPGSKFCSNCDRLIRYEYRNFRRRAALRVWYGDIEESDGLTASDGAPDKSEDHKRPRRVKNGGLIS